MIFHDTTTDQVTVKFKLLQTSLWALNTPPNLQACKKEYVVAVLSLDCQSIYDMGYNDSSLLNEEFPIFPHSKQI